MKIHSLLPVALSFLTFSCEEPTPEPVVIKPAGMEMPGLVFASNPPPFVTPDHAFIEAILTQDAWDIRHLGKQVGFAKDEHELFDILRSLKNIDDSAGRQPYFLISAAGETVVSEITKAIRTAAISGISEVYLLTKNFENTHVPSAFKLRMSFGLCDRQPDISQMFVSIRNDNKVYIGSGPETQRLDQGPDDHDLPGLSAILEIYAAAARSANATPLCAFACFPTASYQRFIDVLSRMHEHGIRYDPGYFLEEETVPENKPLMKKPSSPGRPPNVD
jgi:biopolymer transport protein ExbD